MKHKLWLVGISATAAAFYGVGLFFESNLASPYVGAMTFPFVDRPAAERDYDAVPTDAPIGVRVARANRILEANPASGRSWLVLSYVDWLKNRKRLSPVGILALDRSYTLDPFDHELGPWRVDFSFENWDVISRDQRKTAMSEANWILLNDWRAAQDLKSRLKTVQNPVGRAVAKLELALP